MSYEVKMTDITKLKEYPDNPRINKESVEKVVMSIKEVGWKVPIIVDEKNVILAGHTRLKAAQFLELDKVPVHTAKGLSEQQKTAFRIMDNKSQDFSQWDNELLAGEFAKLADSDYDLDLTGFNFEEIEKMTESLMQFDEPDNFVTEENLDDFGEVQTSNVRMVNIFLTNETEPVFQEMIATLKEKWQKENLTDTVFEAVEKIYKNEGL